MKFYLNKPLSLLSRVLSTSVLDEWASNLSVGAENSRERTELTYSVQVPHIPLIVTHQPSSCSSQHNALERPYMFWLSIRTWYGTRARLVPQCGDIANALS